MPPATFCLTIIIGLAALASGYLFGSWVGALTRNVWLFAHTVLNALRPRDMASILARSTLLALFAGASCYVGGALADILHATLRALTRSRTGLLVISVVVSMLTCLIRKYVNPTNPPPLRPRPARTRSRNRSRSRCIVRREDSKR